MDRELLKQVLQEQQGKKSKTALVQRELWSKIQGHTNTPFIIIISGVRRCGKSTLLQQIRSDVPGYFVNFDDERLLDFHVQDFQMMNELLLELFGKQNTYFFDEIQNVAAWERFVRRLRDEGKKVYISGSNASLLSRELGTHLTGRHISFSLYPFSFREFLRWKKYPADATLLTTEKKSQLRRYFQEFICQGGFPEFLHTQKEEYLKAIYENVIYRDIITRYHLPDELPLKEVIRHATSNIGKEVSFNQLRKLTGLTSATTIKGYFSYLENSYLCFLLPRYGRSLQQQIYSPKKIYFIDTAMARILGFRLSPDDGRFLENIVYLQLLRQGKEIYYHRGKYECDFLVREGMQIVSAIQVTYQLHAKNRQREVMGLMEALKSYGLQEGVILTLDDEGSLEEEGKTIRIIPVWKWLLEGPGGYDEPL